MEKPFYMIFMEGGSAPTYKHEDLASAESEAKRLTTMFKKKVVVLASIKSFEENRFKIEDLRPDNYLPF
jgi:hypothetical protein